MGNYNDLLVYKKAFGLAMKIFSVSKSFPAEEKLCTYKPDKKIFQIGLCKSCRVIYTEKIQELFSVKTERC